MKSLIIIFGALLMIIATPAFFTHVDDVLTDDETNSFTSVTTAAGVTSANVTLANAVYNDNVQQVDSVTSDNTDDAPTAYTYNSVSHVLLVSGLNANDTRTLTVDYSIDNTTLDSGMAIFWTVLRWFWIFVIIGMCGGAVYAFFD